MRLPYEAPLAAFGDGARHGFDWVFEGQTECAVSTFDDILAWLADCQLRERREPLPRVGLLAAPTHVRAVAARRLRGLRAMGVAQADRDRNRRRSRDRAPSAAGSPRTVGTRGFCFDGAVTSSCSSRSSATGTERGGASGFVSARRSTSRNSEWRAIAVGSLFAGHVYFLQNRHLGRARPTRVTRRSSSRTFDGNEIGTSRVAPRGHPVYCACP